MEMLMTEVQRERELVSAHMDARKSTDAQLRREQHTVTELQGTVDSLQQQVSELVWLIRERNTEISELIQIAGTNLSGERKKKAEALASWRHSGSSASSSQQPSFEKSHKEASARGNNPAAPVWVPSQTSPALSAVKSPQDQPPPPEDDDAKLKSLLESLRQH